MDNDEVTATTSTAWSKQHPICQTTGECQGAAPLSPLPHGRRPFIVRRRDVRHDLRDAERATSRPWRRRKTLSGGHKRGKDPRSRARAIARPSQHSGTAATTSATRSERRPTSVVKQREPSQQDEHQRRRSQRPPPAGASDAWQATTTTTSTGRTRRPLREQQHLGRGPATRGRHLPLAPTWPVS